MINNVNGAINTAEVNTSANIASGVASASPATNPTTIRFAVKDSGRESLAMAVGDILRQDAVYEGAGDITQAVGGYVVSCSSRQRNTKAGVAVNIRFTLSNAGRRAFANAVGEILGLDVIYNRTPTFTYAVGNYIVDRDGALICPAGVSRSEINRLVTALGERGYEAETDIGELHHQDESNSIAIAHNSEFAAQLETFVQHPPDDSHRLSIAMPRAELTDLAIDNLQKIIASKATLIKKALAVDSLPLVIGEEMLHFQWFALTGVDGEIDAYLQFVNALCKMARESKRITAKERDTADNDKFAMRVFLIRLGFVGAEYKAARKILLRNLTGNSSWKSGQPPTRGTQATPTTSAIPTTPVAETPTLNTTTEVPPQK